MNVITLKAIKYFGAAILFLLAAFSPSFAHCDGLDGPVVKDARKALETGNVKLVLIWVKEEYKSEITSAFNKTLSIRKLSPEAKEFADSYFFETLVRLHRVGEGASYTGLKLEGQDLGPAIPAAEKAIETGSPKELVKFLQDAVHKGLHPLYVKAIEKKNFDKNDVNAGREYVKDYVEYVHYVEKIYQMIIGSVHSEASPDAHSH